MSKIIQILSKIIQVQSVIRWEHGFIFESQRFKIPPSTSSTPPLMQITVVGKDSDVKTTIIVALNYNLEVVDLYPEQVSDINIYDMVIYISVLDPDQEVLGRLCKSAKSIILIARNNHGSTKNDLFIPVIAFQNLASKRILKEIRSIRDFIEKASSSNSNLSEVQQKIIYHLANGSSEEDILADLLISRRIYFTICAQLRAVYGVSKNRQLITLVQDKNLIQAS